MLNLVLDMDETIINTMIANEDNIKQLESQELSIGSFIINEINKDNENITFHLVVFVRPNLYKFLKFLNTNFNLYVYTHATTEYALNVINLICKNLIDMNIKILQTRIIKDNIIQLKSLSRLNLSKENTFIIDDRIDVWEEEYHNNIIQIEPYYAPHYLIDYKAEHKLIYNKFNWEYNFDDSLIVLINILKNIITCYNKFCINIDKINLSKIKIQKNINL